MNTTDTNGTNPTAFAYLRVSGAGQIDGHGFDRQRTAVAEFAAKNGVRIVAEFRDEAVSGTTEWEARDGERAGVERIAALVQIRTYSLRRIAGTLNAENIPTRSGRPWSAESVRKVAARLAA